MIKKTSSKEIGLKICKMLEESNLSIAESISVLNEVKTNILSASKCSSPKVFTIHPYDPES